MNRKVRAVFHASIIFVFLVILPLWIPSLIPHEIIVTLTQGTIDLPSFLNGIAMVGIVIFALTLAKGFLSEASPAHLIVVVASNLNWLLFTFVVFGLGDISKFGIVTLSSQGGGSSNNVTFDLRLFVYLSTITAALKIGHSYLKFREARLARIKPKSK
jgi:hypothetical protein